MQILDVQYIETRTDHQPHTAYIVDGDWLYGQTAATVCDTNININTNSISINIIIIVILTQFSEYAVKFFDRHPNVHLQFQQTCPA